MCFIQHMANYLNLNWTQLSFMFLACPSFSRYCYFSYVFGSFCSLWSEIRLFGSTDVTPLLCCNIFRWEESLGFMLSVSITLAFNLYCFLPALNCFGNTQACMFSKIKRFSQVHFWPTLLLGFFTCSQFWTCYSLWTRSLTSFSL